MVTQAAAQPAEHIRQIGLVVPGGAPTRGDLGHIFVRYGTLSAPHFGLPLTGRLHPPSAQGPLASLAVGQNPARSSRLRQMERGRSMFEMGGYSGVPTLVGSSDGLGTMGLHKRQFD